MTSLPNPSPSVPGSIFPTMVQLKSFSAGYPIFVRGIALAVNAVFFLGTGLCVYHLFVVRKRDLSICVPAAVCWNIWDVARGGILFLYVGMVLGLLDPIPTGRDIRFITYNLIAEVVAVLYLLGLISGGIGRSLQAIGLRRGRFARQAVFGIAAYVAFIPVFIGLVLAAALLWRRLGIEPVPQRHLFLLARPHSTWGYLYLGAFVACIGPVFEEIFFRGYLFGALRKRWGILCAVLLSALLFSIIHFNAGVLLPVFGLGVLLAYVYERTGSLIAPIVIHVLQNSIALTAVYTLLWIRNNC